MFRRLVCLIAGHRLVERYRGHAEPTFYLDQTYDPAPLGISRTVTYWRRDDLVYIASWQWCDRCTRWVRITEHYVGSAVRGRLPEFERL